MSTVRDGKNIKGVEARKEEVWRGGEWRALRDNKCDTPVAGVNTSQNQSVNK